MDQLKDVVFLKRNIFLCMEHMRNATLSGDLLKAMGYAHLIQNMISNHYTFEAIRSMNEDDLPTDTIDTMSPKKRLNEVAGSANKKAEKKDYPKKAKKEKKPKKASPAKQKHKERTTLESFTGPLDIEQPIDELPPEEY